MEAESEQYVIDLSSDNVIGVCSEIMEALCQANKGSASPYGNDMITASLDKAFAEVFETPVRVFPVGTGTIANALALAQITRPWSSIYCHELAHIERAECGAPEHASGGCKLSLVAGQHAKVSAVALSEKMRSSRDNIRNRVNVTPAAVSVSQATERGTIYTQDELYAIHHLCLNADLRFHMDGARFANAVAALGCSPAKITWQSGIDVLSFGATKNGAMGAEAVIFFRPHLADLFEYRCKRAGQTFSKMRFVSAQLLAYMKDDLWVRNATHANKMARLLADGLCKTPDVVLVHPQEVNELFLSMPSRAIDALKKERIGFSRPDPDDPRLIRLVTACDSEPEMMHKVAQIVSSAIERREGARG